MTVAKSLASVLPHDAVAAEPADAPSGSRPPEAVVRPGSTTEVASLMEWATRQGVGVLPVGSGRRARPVQGDGRYVVLETGRLAGIEEYEAANLTLTAGAGTPFTTLTDALAENVQWAPFDPPLVSNRSLGGFVADGLSGPLRMGYGDLRNHVLGMTVVTGDGRTLRLGGRVVKNVAGYDVLKTVVGSRGSLAVITSVVLRAFPRPVVDRVLIRDGASVPELLDLALEVGTAPVLPVSSVIVDRLPEADGRPALVVRLHGAQETVDADQRRIEEHMGVSFQNGSEVDLVGVRDHAGEGEMVVWVSSLPSRLSTVLQALEALEPAALFVDTYGGLLRMTCSSAPPDAVVQARRRIEAVGGALRVFAPAIEGRAAELGSRPSAGEASLIQGLRRAFDPGEVLWPAGR